MPDQSVSIQEVRTKVQQQQFIKFAWDLYRGDANWIPPLRGNHRELLNFAPHPFYRTAEGQAFLAVRSGQVVGRIHAVLDHAHNKTHDERRGMFGFFESIDDPEVSKALFDAVKQWHAARGALQLRGPLNPAMNYECGLLVEGFDSPPTFMMTYNKPYYERLITDNGFVKAHDLYAYWGHINMLQSLDPKLQFIAEKAKERFNLTVRPLDRKNFRRDVASFLYIYNRALPGTWGFVPFSDAELEHAANGLRQLIIPELTRIAEFEGRPVGVVFALLDYNPLIKEIDGRLFPFGFIKLLWKRRKLKRVRLISTNVLPEFQRWGLGVVLLNELLPAVLKWGVEEGEFSWVLESNHLSRGSLERGGAKRVKSYRIYDFPGA